MAAPDWKRAKEIFGEALERPLAERAAFVGEACAGDPAMRVQVEGLLAALEPADRFMATSPQSDLRVGDLRTTARLTALESDPLPVADRQIGPYCLLERLGEGGFGEVWLAEQREPLHRRVAVKLIKPGMDSRAVVGRFEQERQALAMLDHPNIARVLDAGVTPAPTIRPYFVMEHIKGEPITRYCDRNKLSIRRRLELFTQVCDAVQHAHTKGIIHRDLKPSNVLVGDIDDKPVTKVIDFGIAKAITHIATAHEVFTKQGMFIGTPEYMSPEQAEMGATDIDTRADVYSLGVMLYELLTGSLPIDAASLRSAGLGEIHRMIRDMDPPRPSTRLSGLGDTGVAIAAARTTRIDELARVLRRELEWIPLKALRKDRSKRYRSAAELADDVQNYLANRPLIAGPEGAAYQLKKLARRHRGPGIAAAIVLLAVLVGLAGTLWQARVAKRERNVAVRSQQAEAARANELERVADFQARLLGQVDPTEAGRLLSESVRAKFAAAVAASGTPDTDLAATIESFTNQWRRVNATDTARELIDRTILTPAVQAIDAQFKDQPVVAASLRQVLADRYQALGLYQAAWEQLELALTTRRFALGETHPHTLASLGNMAALLHEMGKLEEAEVACREALDKCTRIRGEDDVQTMTAAFNLGRLLMTRGRTGEASPYLHDVLNRRKRVLGEDHPDTITATGMMGVLLQKQGKLEEAEPFYRDAMERSKRLYGDEHTKTLESINNFALFQQSRGKFGEAERYLRESMPMCRRLFGESHPQTLNHIHNLGLVLKAQGKLDEAEIYYRESLDKLKAVLGDDHPNTITAVATLGRLLTARKQYDKAEPFYRQALERRSRVLGEGHRDSLASLNDLSFLMNAQGRPDLALPFAREALDKRRRALGEEDPDTLTSINNVGFLLVLQSKFDEAEPYFYEVIPKYRRVLGDEHPDTLGAVNNLGSALNPQRKFADTVDALAPAEEAMRRVFATTNPRRLGSFLLNLGLARAGLGEHEIAETLLLEAHTLFVASTGGGSRDTAGCIQTLVEFYLARHAADPAGGHDARAAEWRSKLPASKPTVASPLTEENK